MNEDVVAVNDPALYRRLSEPHESAEAFEHAVKAFGEGLRALREKYRLPDVVYVIAANVIGDDGEERTMITFGNAGDAMRIEPMLSWARGMEKTRRDTLLKALAGDPS